MDRYPPIADHGLIGELQTAALVTTDSICAFWYVDALARSGGSSGPG
jgi:hypothetical protein